MVALALHKAQLKRFDVNAVTGQLVANSGRPLMIGGSHDLCNSLRRKESGQERIRTSEGIASRFTVCPV